MFTVSNNMIYAKKPKVRQDSLYESNKVDSDNLACLTPKKFSNQQEAKNSRVRQYKSILSRNPNQISFFSCF